MQVIFFSKFHNLLHHFRTMMNIDCLLIFPAVNQQTGFLIFQFCPRLLLGMFNSSAEMDALGIPALRIISFCFLPASISIALGAAYQGTGVGLYSMITSILRQLGVLIPAAFIMSRIWGIEGAWWAFAVADIVGLALSIVFYLDIYRKKIVVLKKN